MAYIVNFNEVATTTTVTKAQVSISKEDFEALQKNPDLLEEILENYEADYGSSYEEEFDVEEMELVHMFKH